MTSVVEKILKEQAKSGKMFIDLEEKRLQVEEREGMRGTAGKKQACILSMMMRVTQNCSVHPTTDSQYMY